jgi:hypothetical protein
MSVGWSRNADGVRMPFQVVQFDGAPAARAVTFATLGISSHLLESEKTGREIRQEYLMTCLTGQRDWNIPAVLQQFGAENTRRRRAVLRGEVFGPRGPLFPQSQMTALYAAIPVYFSDELHSVIIGVDKEVVLVWLVPLHTSEAELVRRVGWRSFEERLAETEVDLCDLSRPAIA